MAAVRVAAYVDGFNLYYGLRAKYQRKYLWLDVQALVGNLLRPGQALKQVTYFTARVRNDVDGERRQEDYLAALTEHSRLVTVVDGRFQEKLKRCKACGVISIGYEEKETDVNMALRLIEDAVEDRYDMALLISADSDLCPVITTLKRLRPHKRVVIAFPPKRYSTELKRTANGFVSIGDDKLRRSQLPPVVTTDGGLTFLRPKEWA
jgi:uncharacterized LabA/DUF88 family protein